MDDPNSIVIIACVAFVLLIVLSLVGVQRQAYDPAGGTREFLEAWDARWESGSDSRSENGRITFLLDGRPAAVEFTGADEDGGPTHTHFTAPLPHLKLRLELRPQWRHSTWSQLLHLEDIQVHSSYFDDAFGIQGSSPEQVRDFLTPAVQEAIWNLARSSRFGRFDLNLRIAGGLLRVTRQGRLDSEQELSNLVRSCQKLLRLTHELNSGIEILESSAPRSAHAAECQVCGDPLREKIVYCAKCQTPHHLDCWQYFGSCAVYGCGQKRYVSSHG